MTWLLGTAFLPIYCTFESLGESWLQRFYLNWSVVFGLQTLIDSDHTVF